MKAFLPIYFLFVYVMHVKAQNVGIGLLNPRSNLHIHSQNAARAVLQLTTGGSSSAPTSGLSLGFDQLAYNTEGYAFIRVEQNKSLQFLEGNSLRMAFDPFGRNRIFGQLILSGNNPIIFLYDTLQTSLFGGASNWFISKGNNKQNVLQIGTRKNQAEAYLEFSFSEDNKIAQSAIRVDSSGRIGMGDYNRIALNQTLAAMHVFGRNIAVDGRNNELSAFEFRNNGTYRGALGWDQSAGRFFFFDGESNSNTLFINNGRIGIQRDPATNAFEVNGNASKSSAGDWLANSDERLKKNIAPIRNPLEQLLRLKGITYQWNDTQTGLARPQGTQMGFTAQNIQKVFPELVSTDARGYLQTAYGTYDALLVEAIRELASKVEMLEQKLAAIQNN